MSGKSEPGVDRKHILITGTGRAGTTFLIELLTQLGLDTGFDPAHLKWVPMARAGLEHRFWRGKRPYHYITKSPFACDLSDAEFEAIAGRIEHAIVPIRRFEAAAASRIYVQELKTGQKDGEVVAGGLWGTQSAADQEAVLRFKFTRLVEMLVYHDVPLTFLMYPRIVRDADYVYRKLHFLVGEIDLAVFRTVFAAVVRPDWVHQFGDNDR